MLGVRPASAQGLRVAQPNAAHFPEVTLYAYPTDHRGVVLENLAPNTFHVVEDGKDAGSPRVTVGGGSLDICLALDRSPSMLDEGKLGFAKRAAREFLRQLGPDDRAAFLTFASGAVLDQPLTRDRDSLLAAVDHAQASGNTTTLYDALYWSVEQVAVGHTGSLLGAASARAEARRVVIAITDGLDLSSHTPPEAVIRSARANGVTICTIALGSDAETRELEEMARETGGLYLRAPEPQDLSRLYATLAEQLRKEYRVTYRSPRPEADATRRNITLSVTGVPQLANTWYQAPGQGSLLVTVPAAAGPSGASAVGTPAAAGDNRLLLGSLLVLVGVGSLVAAFLWWMGTRRETLTVTDSNPRMDLLPLWVREGQTRVGRGEECELVLDSRRVSRVHARIEAASGIVRLIDEGSINGTYVNGRRVRNSQILQVGDVLRFGDQEFQYAGEAPADA